MLLGLNYLLLVFFGKVIFEVSGGKMKINLKIFFFFYVK